jgi:hypothetical protein
MREIKFRAWKMLERVIMQPREIGLIDFFGGRMWVDKTLYFFDEDRYGDKVDSVLMQFTGLHDSYGVEIYEGDIILYFNGDDFRDVIEIVEFDDLTDVPDWLNWSVKTVIGNIYENPELV